MRALGGQPINVATGAKYQVEPDIAAGTGGQLSLTRYYNSDRLERPLTSLGAGWRMTYDRSIAALEQEGVPTVVVYRQDGKGLYFEQSGSDWVPDSDVTYALSQRFDGSAFLGWELVDDQDNVELYDVDGRLTRIASRDSRYSTWPMT